MTLLVDELYENVIFEQEFRINKTLQLAHFRPWIIKWGTPDGTMVCQIWQDATLLKEVKLTSTEINLNVTATYAHGQLRFDTSPLQLNHDRSQEYTYYTVKIFMENNTTDSNNFYGIVRRYENKFYPTYGAVDINGEGVNDMIEPMGFEMFEWSY